MSKSLRILLVAGLLLAILATVAYRSINASLTEFEVEQVTDDLYMLHNEFGGNVAVLRTGAGSVIVDTLTFSVQGEAIQRQAQELTGEPVTAIINSHYHLDHTHGNPAFPTGTQVYTSSRTLHHLLQLDSSTFSGDAAALLPQVTVELEEVIEIGNKTLRLFHPGRGHTDGDLVVLFVEDRTLHTGDLFFNRLYPQYRPGGGRQHPGLGGYS